MKAPLSKKTGAAARAARFAAGAVAAVCGCLAGGTLHAADAGTRAEWPPTTHAPAGAPNVVLILLDDVGYGWSSVFGGPVPTPNIDRLASQGLRYNNFHVNSLCSPTRGSLQTGRNAHEIGFGTVTEQATPAPGYTSIWPKNAVSVAEVLKRNGYSTAAFDKWHNTPMWEVNPAGPFDHWPTSPGFEYFYGFLGGAKTKANGVIIAQGGTANSFALYLENGKPALAIRSDSELMTVRSEKAMAAGRHQVQASLAHDGAVTILVDGQTNATGQVSRLIDSQPVRGLTVGKSALAVGDYTAPNAFDGGIENARVETR